MPRHAPSETRPASLEPQAAVQAPVGASPPPPHASRRPVWRRPRVLLTVLGALLALGVAGVALSSRTAAPPPAATPTSSALVAHGQIMPARQARVGTQAGGVVQTLDARLGAEVTAQTPLAVIVGAGGTEVVTAPFDGSVSNVLVHAGDTLAPGATVAVVADLHTLQVETLDIDEFLVGHIKVGQRVQVTVDALDNLALTGMVSQLALLPQTATTGGQAYPAIIAIGGVPPAVHAGMSVRITLPE
jgi:multidrug efflux pump subunit AcrA (membrane-fusion protein)